MRKVLFLFGFMFITLPAFSQNKSASENLRLSGGWFARFDHPGQTLKDIQFSHQNGILHFKAGPNAAAIYYNPEQQMSGTYVIEGMFTQLQKTRHAEAYGLFIGGSHLQNANQQYIYFLVRQNGMYLIKRRTGSKTSLIVGWTDSQFVHSMNSDGVTQNHLSIIVHQKVVDFMVNGVIVKSLLRSSLKNIAGQVGIRVNHHLNLTVSDYYVKPIKD